MSTRRASLLILLSLGSLLLGQWDAAAADKSSSVDKNPKTGSLSAVLGVPNMPSLSGLIRPEKMGLLTDNKLTAKDNEAHLLSDNETDVDILFLFPRVANSLCLNFYGGRRGVVFGIIGRSRPSGCVAAPGLDVGRRLVA
jgi:hypothetical protein